MNTVGLHHHWESVQYRNSWYIKVMRSLRHNWHAWLLIKIVKIALKGLDRTSQIIAYTYRFTLTGAEKCVSYGIIGFDLSTKIISVSRKNADRDFRKNRGSSTGRDFSVWLYLTDSRHRYVSRILGYQNGLYPRKWSGRATFRPVGWNLHRISADWCQDDGCRIQICRIVTLFVSSIDKIILSYVILYSESWNFISFV